MRTYKRINEDFLDTSNIELDDMSALNEIRFEISKWVSGGPAPTLDVQKLPDGFYKPVAEKPSDNRKLLKQVINVACEEYGNKCSLNWIDVSHIDNMFSLFSNSMFNGDISRWDVSHVTNMVSMFCNSRFNGNISDWDVSSVKDMSSMFAGSGFNGNISEWDVSHVTNMRGMFYNSRFNGNISDWDVSNVEIMVQMFCFSKFNQDISRWDVSRVAGYAGIFKGCPIREEYKPLYFRI